MDKGVCVCVRARACVCVCMCRHVVCAYVFVHMYVHMWCGVCNARDDIRLRVHTQAIEFCRMHQGRLYASTASLLWH